MPPARPAKPPHANGVDRFAIELKTRRDGDPDPRERGIEQLSGYLERLGLAEGTLILFDQRRIATTLPERISRARTEQGGKTIELVRI